jgi:hypothetical protein
MSLAAASISPFAVTRIFESLGGGALGLMDDEGDKLGLVEGDADELALLDGLTLALVDGLSLLLGDTLALADADGDGEALTLADGLRLGLTEGLTDDDGDALGEPSSATTISAHTFTPLVACRRENVCTQNSYTPAASAGQVNVALLASSGLR